MSLLEVTISLGVMAVAAVAFSSVMLNQKRATQAMAEQLAIQELRPLLSKALSKNDACEAHFGGMNFDPNSPLKIPEIRAGSAPNAPLLAKVGVAPSSLAQTLKVQALHLHSFTSVQGLSDQFDAKFTIFFKGPPTAMRSHSPIEMDARVATQPNSNTISSCKVGLHDAVDPNALFLKSFEFRVAITFVDDDGNSEKCRGLMLKGTQTTDGRVLPDANGSTYYIGGGSNMQRQECVNGLFNSVTADTKDLSNNPDFYELLRTLNPGFKHVLVQERGWYDLPDRAYPNQGDGPWNDFVWRAMVFYTPE